MALSSGVTHVMNSSMALGPSTQPQSSPRVVISSGSTSTGPPTTGTTSLASDSFLADQDVLSVHVSFAVITLLYIPFILVNNNLVLCSTLLFRKLHTPHNLMLASLAVADLIMGVYCIPMYALSYIPSTQHLVKDSGKFACLAWFASIELGGASSLKNLLLISTDRFIAVVFPLSYHKIMTMRTAVVTIAILWVYVIIMTLVPFLGWNNYNAEIVDENKRCNYYLTLPEGYVIWASFFTITVSITVPLLLNIKIFYTVCKQQRSIRAYQHLWSDKQIKRFRDRVQTVRITGVLCLLFILFWLPYMLVAPLKYTMMSPKEIEIVKVVVQLLYFLNSVVNAPIYALMRTEYKVAYCLLLTTPVCRWRALRRHTLVADPPQKPSPRRPRHADEERHPPVVRDEDDDTAEDPTTAAGAGGHSGGIGDNIHMSSHAVTPASTRHNTVVTIEEVDNAWGTTSTDPEPLPPSERHSEFLGRADHERVWPEQATTLHQQKQDNNDNTSQDVSLHILDKENASEQLEETHGQYDIAYKKTETQSPEKEEGEEQADVHSSDRSQGDDGKVDRHQEPLPTEGNNTPLARVDQECQRYQELARDTALLQDTPQQHTITPKLNGVSSCCHSLEIENPNVVVRNVRLAKYLNSRVSRAAVPTMFNKTSSDSELYTKPSSASSVLRLITSARHTIQVVAIQIHTCPMHSADDVKGQSTQETSQAPP